MKLIKTPAAAWWLVLWWSMCRTLVCLATPMGVVAFVGSSASTPPTCTGFLLMTSSSSSSQPPRRQRPRPVRIPPSNPEEVEAARNGNWNYDTGCISNNNKDNDDEINYGDEELEEEE